MPVRDVVIRTTGQRVTEDSDDKPNSGKGMFDVETWSDKIAIDNDNVCNILIQ
jgi:hypothetical protein